MDNGDDQGEILSVHQVRITTRRTSDNVVALTNEEIERLVEGRVTDAYGDGGVTVRASAERVDI